MTQMQTSGTLRTIPDERTWTVQWSPIIAGAIAAAGLAFVLHSFALSLGLGVSSSAPTWRDASFTLIFMTGLYLVLAALASYGLGGYIAGRLSTSGPVPAGGGESDFVDGMRGLIVWGIATLITAFVALSVASSVTRLAASGASAGPSASVAGENIIAYDVDRLFRSDRRPQGDMTPIRSEAGRILLTTSSHRGMLPEDRAHLIRLVSGMTGLNPPEAERRVDDVSARAKDNLSRARKSAVLLGFMAGAAALLGALAAWYAACAGGRYRDGRDPTPRLWDWGRP